MPSGTHILVDCPLGHPQALTTHYKLPRSTPSYAASASRFRFVLPNLDSVDPATIDAVLLTNSSSWLGLPYLTERTTFRGEILASEAAAQLGSIVLEELVASFGDDVGYIQIGYELQPMFSLHELRSCMAKIQRVSHNQILRLGSDLMAVPVSSGFNLGSTNWILDTSATKIGIVGVSSVSQPQHSSRINTEALNDCSIWIFHGSIAADHSVSPIASINSLCERIAMAVDRGGNVILPIGPCGYLYDLLDIISKHLRALGMSQFPMHYVSPVAKRSLHMANILGEWASTESQENLYSASTPLTHGELLEHKRLYLHPTPASILRMKGPYIIFTDHASLLSGSVRGLVAAYRQDPNSVLILTDPSFTDQSRLTSFMPLKMKIQSLPIDTSLTLQQIAALLDSQTSPKIALFPSLPHLYPILAKSLAPSAGRVRCLFSQTLGELMEFPLGAQKYKALLSEESASEITPRLANSWQHSLSTVRGHFRLGPNETMIVSLDPPASSSSSSSGGGGSGAGAGGGGAAHSDILLDHPILVANSAGIERFVAACEQCLQHGSESSSVHVVRDGSTTTLIETHHHVRVAIDGQGLSVAITAEDLEWIQKIRRLIPECFGTL
ncbi:beta-lactamase-like protein [Polychytrium aggregatum]|uniref:beta-lactamase-like protein n=1 Tax=Polychytrium aggregatum TaxID=110093 RepID=UPI0022FF190A|nr:beta-lactamase-like protein [Polychytrium aggregatum]KAI9203967.1 beta-lactamase-like protein [Polychytrium aggregatum]